MEKTEIRQIAKMLKVVDKASISNKDGITITKYPSYEHKAERLIKKGYRQEKQLAKEILDEVYRLVEKARLESEYQNEKGEWVIDEHEFMSEFTLGDLPLLYKKYGLKFLE